MSSRVCFVFAKLSVLSILVFTVGATGVQRWQRRYDQDYLGARLAPLEGAQHVWRMAVTSAGATGSASGATAQAARPAKAVRRASAACMGTGTLAPVARRAPAGRRKRRRRGDGGNGDFGTLARRLLPHRNIHVPHVRLPEVA